MDTLSEIVTVVSNYEYMFKTKRIKRELNDESAVAVIPYNKKVSLVSRVIFKKFKTNITLTMNAISNLKCIIECLHNTETSGTRIFD